MYGQDIQYVIPAPTPTAQQQALQQQQQPTRVATPQSLSALLLVAGSCTGMYLIARRLFGFSPFWSAAVGATGLPIGTLIGLALWPPRN